MLFVIEPIHEFGGVEAAQVGLIMGLQWGEKKKPRHTLPPHSGANTPSQPTNSSTFGFSFTKELICIDFKGVILFSKLILVPF